MSFVLPKTNQTGPNEWLDVEANDVKLKEEIEATQAEVTAVKQLGKWYTPKIIATEETRASTEFGFLTTEDKIENVVLPENGLLIVSYMALVKASVEFAGRVAIFIGPNQLKERGTTVPVVQEAASGTGAGFNTLSSMPGGLRASGFGGTSFATTGQALSIALEEGGRCEIFGLSAGTYTVGVKYRATSGSITAKERKLWVRTEGY